MLETFENEETWSQRSIDKPAEVLNELKRLKEQQTETDVTQSATATVLPIRLDK